MNVWVLILIIVLLFGTGFGGHRAWTTIGPYAGGGIGLLGILIIVLIVLALTGRL